MNIPNILAVADAIEKHTIPDLGFNMSIFRDECGTTACIAGWACAIDTPNGTFGSFEQARHFLDLDLVDTGNLFFMDNSSRQMSSVSSTEAVAVLRKFAKTGTIDWS